MRVVKVGHSFWLESTQLNEIVQEIPRFGHDLNNVSDYLSYYDKYFVLIMQFLNQMCHLMEKFEVLQEHGPTLLNWNKKL